MAEKYTAWLWRARSVIGKRRMYTTRHHMDEETAAGFFAKEGVTEYFKLEDSAVIRERNLTADELMANCLRVLRPGDPGYIADPDQRPRYQRELPEKGES